jgi:hypothetical protein
MPIVYNMGSILGPAFGGALSNPYHRVPGTPAGPHLFEIFPYALPNVASACFFMIGITIGIFFLKETLPSRKDRKDIGLRIGEKIITKSRNFSRGIRCMVLERDEEETKPLIGSPSTGNAELFFSANASDETPGLDDDNRKSMPSWRDVMSKQSCLNLAAYGLLCMHSLSYDQILPVFMHHPVQDINSSSVQLPFKFSGGFGISKSQIFQTCSYI